MGLFQIYISIIVCLSQVVKYPVTGGIAFVEKVPPLFECYHKSASQMADVHPTWNACTKDDICASPGIEYRPVKSDPEYFNNWNQ